MLDLRGVRIPVGTQSPLSFALEPGSITAIIGPPGAGKSILLSSIGNRTENVSGALIDGILLGRIPFRKYPVFTAYFSGNPPKDTGGKVYDYLLLARSHLKRFMQPFGEHHIQALESVIESFDLSEYRETPLHALSSDPLRRTLIAFYLLRDSKLLLLDDPATGLGIRSLGILQKALIRYTMRGDRTVLFASSDLSFAAQTADRILILDEGRLVGDLAPEALDADIIRRHFKTEVLVSRNIYNGRPDIHFFPGV